MSQASVDCSERTLLAIEALANSALPNETGGLLIGYRHKDGTVTVTRVLEVPDASATPVRYVQRHAIASRVLADFLSRQGQDTVEGYVGNWHTHPARAASSNTDLATLARNAVLDGSPVALLTLMRDDQRWAAEWHVATAAPGRRRRVTIQRVGG